MRSATVRRNAALCDDIAESVLTHIDMSVLCPTMQDLASAATRIRELRESAELSVIGLAFKSGVNPRTIERIEAGQVEPRRGTLVLLAGALGVDATELGVRAPKGA